MTADGTLWVVHHDALALAPQLSTFGRIRVAARGAEHVVLRVSR